MTPVSPFLPRAALSLIAGAAVATVAVGVAPSLYYDAVEWHLAEIDAPFVWTLTVSGLVSDLLMAAFLFLIGKEGWEALTQERSGMTRPRAVASALAAIGGMAGAAIIWALLTALFETADEARGAPGWLVPMGADVVLSYLFGRWIFGPGHRALQLLLFLTVVQPVLALVLAGFVAPTTGTLRPLWLGLSLAVVGAAWLLLTRPAERADATELTRARALLVWPWVVLALVSWAGVAASGLPGCLGFLPLLPAMPRASRAFGLFALAEEFLTDPANRLARRLLPMMAGVLFLFGLTQGGVAAAAAAPTTWIALGALWLGKPLGLLAVAWLALRVPGITLPSSIDRTDLVTVAALCGIGFTAPVLAMATALPGGAMQEAARLGLALSLLAGPAAFFAARRLRHRRGLPPHDR